MQKEKKKRAIMHKVETGAKEGRKVWGGKKGLGLGLIKAPKATNQAAPSLPLSLIIELLAENSETLEPPNICPSPVLPAGHLCPSVP